MNRKLSTQIEKIRYAPAGYLAKALVHIFCHSIFWLWNLLFLGVVYLGFMPFIGVPLVRSLVAGEIPFPFVLPLLGFLIVPPACTIFGLIKLRKHPVLLMRLFYGVEAPILTLCILRMFIFRELTPASTLMVVTGAIAIATLALELTFGYAIHKKGLAWFQMVTHTVVLIMGLYVGTVLLFYTVPILCQFLYAFFRFEWLGSLLQVISSSWYATQTGNIFEQIWFFLSGILSSLLFLGSFALFGFSTTLFLAMPYAMVNMFVRSWGRILQAFGRQFSWRKGWLITGGTVTLFSLLFLLTWPQPQVKAFSLLADAPDSITARQELINKSPQIRQGLLNAYLFPYRYLSPKNEVNFIEWWYAHVFPIDRPQARVFQNMHNALMSPFLYRGDRADIEKAAQLYAEFFDTPIQKAEAETIQQALQSTVNRDSVEASLLNINDRVVALATQEVTVAANGDWAEVTLHERYENDTTDDQEIVYQFSLPESAAITGLWLKEPDVAERYRFVVSPRGAAQAVYKQEIERANWTQATDPALLEQVGPRQYRLRVFPIPARDASGEPGTTDLWMTYQVVQQDGRWPLPQLTEKRNLYWTQKTERSRNDKTVSQPMDIWYEAALPAVQPTAAAAHTATLAEGYQVTATPLKAKDTVSLAGQRLAILVDTSRSMGDRVEILAQALEDSRTIASNNTIDWYLTSAPGIPPQRFATDALPALKDLAFYGSLPLTEQLNQFETLRQGETYDAVFILTDTGNYELETDEASVPTTPGSLWLVHLGGEVPNAYTDNLLQQLYDSQGGVAANLLEAVNRLATEQAIDGTVMDGYRWEITSNPNKTTDNAEFEPFAARQTIRWLSRDRDMTQLAELDGLHAIAKRTEVVTPYSSMLVLVNDRQREALAEAEGSVDRFDRELEGGEDTLTDPGNPLNVPAVPETESVLGIVLAGGGLLWILRRSRSQPLTTPRQKL
ncbi:MAG: TIGR02921 family PEP-CTERM protein [Cyanobacteria bacterium P01_F01_bin.86]